MLEVVLKGVLPALGVAFVMLAVSYRLWRWDRRTPGGDWGVTVALGVGFIAGAIGAAGMPQRWPLEKWQWIFILAAVTTLACLSLARRTMRRWRVVLGPVAVLFTFLLLSSPGTRHFWEGGPSLDLTWKLMTAAAVGVIWLAAEPIAAKRPGASLPLALVAVLISASAVVMLSGNDRLARMLGAAVVALAVCIPVAWLRPALSLAGGPTAIIAVALAGIVSLARSYSYSDVPDIAYALPVLAPVALYIAEIPAFRNLKSWQMALLRLLLVAIPCGIALALAAASVETDIYY